MALLSIKEIPYQGQNGSVDLARRVRHYTRAFRARTDNPKASSLEVTSGGFLPNAWSSYVGPNGELDYWATMRQIEAERDNPDDPCQWLILCHYSNERIQTSQAAPSDYSQGNTQGTPADANPFAQPP